MCGIYGELALQEQVIRGHSHDLVARMARRGPDDCGIWHDAQRCVLGFHRLAILDLLPTGHQPMLTPDGRYALVYNGELYNYQMLRQELEQSGIRFRSTGDSEVVLYALARWGAKVLERFNGMFALGFYDVQEKRLILARDHAGIKPLYYLLNQSTCVFASQYDQIMAHPAARNLPVAEEALALYLRLGYIPAPYALLQQTFMLEPGCWLEVNQTGQVKTGRYYTFPLDPATDLHGEEAYEAVDAAITAAVKRQMISDVPLAAFLSGGIDSPLVVSKMQAVSNQPIKAFTIGTGGDTFDESTEARRYADALGVTHVVEHVTADDALALLDDVIAAATEPFADYSIFPTLLVSRLARQEATVMLSGDGGDELFWGYAARFGSVLRLGEGFRHPLWWRKAQWGLKKQFPRLNGHQNLTWPTIGDWYRTKHTHLSERWIDKIFGGAPAWPDAFRLFDYNGWERGRTAQWLRWNEYNEHLTRVLLKVDRASMYNALEVRVPLLDREVIATALRVDWRSCLDLGTLRGKIPLRNSLARHIPFQTQAKRGFSVPMGEWCQGPLRPLLTEKLLNRQEILGWPINKMALHDLYQRHLTGRSEYGWSLWLLLSLVLWVERHYLPAQSSQLV